MKQYLKYLAVMFLVLASQVVADDLYSIDRRSKDTTNPAATEEKVIVESDYVVWNMMLGEVRAILGAFSKSYYVGKPVKWLEPIIYTTLPSDPRDPTYGQLLAYSTAEQGILRVMDKMMKKNEEIKSQPEDMKDKELSNEDKNAIDEELKKAGYKFGFVPSNILEKVVFKKLGLIEGKEFIKRNSGELEEIFADFVKVIDPSTIESDTAK